MILTLLLRVALSALAVSFSLSACALGMLAATPGRRSLYALAVISLFIVAILIAAAGDLK